MPLPADLQGDWPVISQLLDEALTLPPAQRSAFLHALPPQHAPLRDTLRVLLSQAAAVNTEDFLATLPRFTQSAARGPLAELAVDDTIGPYRLLAELGSGGMGAVWLAERSDGQLKRKVALKLPRLAWVKGLAERMARERDILAKLEHPNIARLYDAGLDAMGRPYLALEYVEGQPIDVYARERGLGVKDRLQLLLQVCSAVAFAHSRLVVHRDLKPSNILVTADGQVRLLDFGIAKLMEGDSAKETQLTQLAGRALTLDYASPEQIKGEPIGTASDVYSLGVVAYELLTGAKPYKLKRGSAAELEEAIALADAPKASDAAAVAQDKRALRGDVDAILNKALKKVPGARYATVDALATDIQGHCIGSRVVARPDTLDYRLRRLAHRHRIALTAGGVVAASFGLAFGAGATAVTIVALLAGLGAALWQADRARRKAAEASANAAHAEAVQNYLLGIFRTNTARQADPAKARNTTARELLDIGRDKLDQALSDQPAARAQVALLLSDLYSELGLASEAASLARAAVAQSARAHGEGSLQHLEALATLVYTLSHVGGGLDERRAAGDQIETLLQAHDPGPCRLRALARRAIALSRFGDEALLPLQGAIDDAEAAQDHREALRSLELMGQRLIMAWRHSEAATFFERALEYHARLPDRNDYESLFMLTGLAESYAWCLRMDDAVSTMQLAHETACRTAGLDGLDALQTGWRLGRILMLSGRLDEADAQFDAVLRVAEDPTRPDLLTAANTMSEKATALRLRGEETAAIELHERAVRSVDAVRPDTPLACAARERFATTLIECGDWRRAEDVYADLRARRTRLKSAPGRPDFDATLIIGARCQLAVGNPDAARALLQQCHCLTAPSRTLVGLDARVVLLECCSAGADRTSAERVCAELKDWWRQQQPLGWAPFAYAAFKLAEAEWRLGAGLVDSARECADAAAALLPAAPGPSNALKRRLDALRLDSAARAA
jgi:serine/threonine-protein kinase